MSKGRIRFAGLLAIMLLCLIAAGSVSAADEFPCKPIAFIVPWNPGGSADLTARIIATIAPKYFSVPFTVYNKAGGGGALATRYVAKAKPDGYTLLAGYGGGEHISTPHVRKVPFDILKDFAPICNFATVPIVITVRPDSPLQDCQGLGGICQEESRQNQIRSLRYWIQHRPSYDHAEL